MVEEASRACTSCGRHVSAYVAMCPFCDTLLDARPRPRRPTTPRPVEDAPLSGDALTPVAGVSAVVLADAGHGPPAPPMSTPAQVSAPPAPAQVSAPPPFAPAPAQVSAPPPFAPAPAPPPFAPAPSPVAARPAVLPLSPALHAMLFVIALPALVPGLVVELLLSLAPRARPRWTRGPLIVPALSLVLVLGAVARHPMLAVIQLAALGSMTYLYLRSSWAQRGDDGPSLGYSIKVIALVLAGGALAYVGAFAWLASLSDDAIVTPEDVVRFGEPRPVARVRDVALDGTRLFVEGSHVTLSQVYAGRAEQWARVAGTKGRLWMVVPNGEWSPPEIVHVEVVRHSPDKSRAVMDLARDNLPAGGEPHVLSMRLLKADEVAEIRRRLELERDTPPVAYAVIPGAVLLAIATVLAARSVRASRG